MKLLLFVSLLTIPFTFSFAGATPAVVDVARVYCVKARVQMKNGTTVERFFTFGSYWMEVNKDSAGYYYKSWEHNTSTSQQARLKAQEENDQLLIDKTECLFSQRLLSLTYDTLYLHKAMKVIRIKYNETYRLRIAVPWVLLKKSSERMSRRSRC